MAETGYDLAETGNDSYFIHCSRNFDAIETPGDDLRGGANWLMLANSGSGGGEMTRVEECGNESKGSEAVGPPIA